MPPGVIRPTTGIRWRECGQTLRADRRPTIRCWRIDGNQELQDGRNAMSRLVVIYKTPKDKAAFDKYYFGTHVPLAKTIPGLRKYEVSQGPVVTPAGPSDFHLVATLHFADMVAIGNAFASAEGH